MKNIAAAIVAIFSLTQFAHSHAQDSSIRIGGSTTSLPVISSCSAHFMEKYPTWDKADPSLGKDTTVIYVTGGGSGFGDKDTVFGELAGDSEVLEAGYRSHGSLHESDVPLVVYNYRGDLPPRAAFSRNADAASFLFR